MISQGFNTFKENAELKQAQAEREMFHSLLCATLDSTADGIVIVDTEGKIISLNNTFVGMWDIPQAIVDSRDSYKVLAFIETQVKQPETGLNKIKQLSHHAETNAYNLLELKDGRYLEVFSQPQRLDGKIIGRAFSYRDVTKQKSAERSLKIANEQLESKVQERTNALKQANEQLHQEIEQRKQIEQQLLEVQVALQKSALELEIRVEERTAELSNTNEQLQQEIASRRQVEAKLEQSFSLLRATLESTADGIIVVDTAGRVASFNQRLVEMWRIPDSLVLSEDDEQTLAFILAPIKDLQAYLARLKELFGQPEAESYDLIEFHDGRTFERYSRPQRLGDKIVGRVWSFRDITQRKQAEEALRQSEERFRIAAMSTSDLIYDWDINTGKLAWFGDIDRQLGYSPEEFPRTLAAWEQRIHPEDCDRAMSTLNLHLQTGQPFQAEYRVQRQDGTYLYWIDRGIALRDENGHPYKLIGTTTNVTDKTIAESSLHSCSVINHAILNAIPDAMFHLSADGKFLDCKVAQDFSLFVPPEEFLGKTISEILPNEVAAQILYYIERAISTGEMQTTEYQLPQDEETRHYEARLVLLDDSEVLAIVRDVSKRKLAEAELEQAKAELERRVIERTADLEKVIVELADEIAERKQVEEALRKSEERFRNLVESTSDIIWEMNENGVYTYLSPQVYNVLGYKPEALLGKTIFELMPPSEAWRICNLIGAIASDAKAFTSLEKTNIHKDGHLVVLECGGVPIVDGEGTFRGYRGIKRDITQRKQAEDILRQQASAFENVYDSIIITDWHGRIINWNTGSERLFGYAKQEVLGKTTAFLHTAEHAGILTQEILEAIKQNDRWMGEIEFICKDGFQGVCETIFVPVHNDDGNPIAIVGINHDVTARKQAEAEMQKALLKEKQLTEMKSRFVSMVSHDLRNPLTTILASTELLEFYSARLSGEKKLSHLKRIQTSVRKMTQLLEDILFIGQAEAGQMLVAPVELNLKAFCQELVEDVQLTHGKTHCVIFDYQEECSQVEMDEKLLRKILMNLLSNAVKYSPNGGRVELTVNCKKDETMFRVRDEGIGIPKAGQRHLFETFHRSSNVGNISGTGLGMAIVKNAIDLQGGSITFESEVGVGSTFTICIPTTQRRDFIDEEKDFGD